MGEWYCRINGTAYGPLTTAELLSMARKGRLLPTHKVKKSEGGSWLAASSVSGLFAAANDHPPPVGKAAAALAAVLRHPMFPNAAFAAGCALAFILFIAYAVNTGPGKTVAPGVPPPPAARPSPAAENPPLYLYVDNRGQPAVTIWLGRDHTIPADFAGGMDFPAQLPTGSWASLKGKDLGFIRRGDPVLIDTTGAREYEWVETTYSLSPSPGDPGYKRPSNVRMSAGYLHRLPDVVDDFLKPSPGRVTSTTVTSSRASLMCTSDSPEQP